jgi:protocatechuate 3,4-dioxygenase beta subunit
MRNDEIISRRETLTALPGARQGESGRPGERAREGESARPGESARQGESGRPGESARQGENAWQCVLAPASAGQIHHLPLELVRRDIAGDRPGVPLMLRIRVLDARTTDPVIGAVLDIRHRDALGETILRGAQVSDQEGYAEFRTVHPGWLPGRPVHLSAEVHVGARLAGGRSVAHAGRLYLPEPISAEVARLAPYREIPAARVVNTTEAGLLHVVPRDRFDLAAGLLATITVGVG